MTASLGYSRARQRDPLLGTVINGRFRVEEPLARGGMGKVYLARQAHVDRLVALKVVTANDADPDSRGLRRFLLEASILAKIQHPNVVTLFDYGRIEGAPVETYFIAMEYLRGETLAARLKARSALPVADAMAILEQLASGLREAHFRGIVHRDIKPSNIVLSVDEKGEIAKLVDFGVGKLARGGEHLTKNGVLVGTPKYMAPEQFEGTSSPASDIYALGLVAYEMLVGKLPFTGSSAAEFMVAKLRQPFRPMREVAPNQLVPDAIEHLVRRMLALAPEKRPTTEALYQDVLREAFRSSAIRRKATPPPLPAESRRPPPLPAPTPSTPTIRLELDSHDIRVKKTLSTLGGTPEASPRGRKRLVVAATLVAFVFLALGFMPRRLPPQPPAPTAPSASSTTPPRVSIRLRIESIPPGATVIENQTVIGATPLDVDMSDRNATMRTFHLRKDGYGAVTFAEEPLETSTTRTVVLAIEPAPPEVRAPSRTASPSPRPLDIRRSR